MLERLDWLIIGGGVHGTLLSRFLTGAAGVPRERLRVLDPHEDPLARWDHCTANTGMEFMRSPSVHHLDVESFSVRRFTQYVGEETMRFAPPYHRPHLEVFRAHCAHVIEAHDLRGLRLQGSAHGLERKTGYWEVETDRGCVHAEHVVLAMGASDHLGYPDWVSPRLKPRVQHLFDPDFDRTLIAPEEDVAIVGCGISAAQLALALANRPEGSGGVTVFTRRKVYTRQFDIDPGWLGPRYLARFQREPSMVERRSKIRAARGVATIPPEIWRAVRRARHAEQVEWLRAEVAKAELDSHGRLQVTFTNGSRAFDRLVLATGFVRTCPRPSWLDRTIETLDLPLAPCGYPIVDDALAWAPGLHVTGPLAELVIGPAARNIAGARMAASRLTAHARA